MTTPSEETTVLKTRIELIESQPPNNDPTPTEPPITHHPGEDVIKYLSYTRSAIYGAAKDLIESDKSKNAAKDLLESGASKRLKFFIEGTGTLPGSLLSISMDINKEGLLQAVITEAGGVLTSQIIPLAP